MVCTRYHRTFLTNWPIPFSKKNYPSQPHLLHKRWSLSLGFTKVSLSCDCTSCLQWQKWFKAFERKLLLALGTRARVFFRICFVDFNTLHYLHSAKLTSTASFTVSMNSSSPLVFLFCKKKNKCSICHPLSFWLFEHDEHVNKPNLL